MWNSFRTDALDGLTAEVITYPGGGGDEIHAYVARPTQTGRCPGSWPCTTCRAGTSSTASSPTGSRATATG